MIHTYTIVISEMKKTANKIQKANVGGDVIVHPDYKDWITLANFNKGILKAGKQYYTCWLDLKPYWYEHFGKAIDQAEREAQEAEEARIAEEEAKERKEEEKRSMLIKQERDERRKRQSEKSPTRSLPPPTPRPASPPKHWEHFESNGKYPQYNDIYTLIR